MNDSGDVPAPDPQNAAALVAELLRVSALTEYIPCRGGGEYWYSTLAREQNQAKQECGGCPVRDLCLAAALATRDPWGVWGATVPRERRAILKGHGMKIKVA